MKSVPGNYFKYRPIGRPESLERSRLKQIIVETEIYFAKPCDLNDPFDCAPIAEVPKVGVLRKQVEKMLRNVTERRNLTLTKTQKSATASEAMSRLGDPRTRNQVLYDALNMNTAVFCMSADPKNSLQWSYYGAIHSGVCLEFEMPDRPDWFVIRVEYKKTRPTIDIARFHGDSDYRLDKLGEAVSTKSKDWDHEQEFRAFSHVAENKKYDPDQLLSLTFGMDAPDEYIEYVLSLVEASPCNPNLFKCRAKNDAYGLTREPFSA